MAILPAPPGRARRRGQRIAGAAPESGAATGPLRRPLGPPAAATAAGPAVPAAPAAEPLSATATATTAPTATTTTTAPAATTTATTTAAAATRAEVSSWRPPVSIPFATTTGRRHLRLPGHLPGLLG